MTGVWVLVSAIVASLVITVVKEALDGRFRPSSSRDSSSASTADDVLTAEDIEAPLGERATFVQFSSSFCAPCRATRVLLSDVVAAHDGVAHVEIDAESHLDLVRRLHILRTPTVIVLGPDGRIRGRASGLPRRDQVEAALAAVA